MRKFIFKISSFIVTIILTVFILEFLIHQCKEDIFSEDKLEHVFQDEVGAYRWINTMKSDSLIVLSGSSSVRYGLSCSMLNQLSSDHLNYVSIAMDARDPIETYFILKSLKKQKIHSVYFGLDPWIYAKRYYKHRTSYLYLDLTFIQVLKMTYEYDKNAFLSRYKKFFEYLFHNENDSNENIQNSIPSDFGSATLDKKPTNFNKVADDWFQIEKYGWSDLQFKYLQKIVTLCEEKDIEFILLIPPKRLDYSTIYQEKCQDIHNQYISHLSNSVFSNPIIGTFDQFKNKGDSIFFVEPYHLNKKGQEEYSKLFYKMTEQKKECFSRKYKWFIK